MFIPNKVTLNDKPNKNLINSNGTPSPWEVEDIDLSRIKFYTGLEKPVEPLDVQEEVVKILNNNQK